MSPDPATTSPSPVVLLDEILHEDPSGDGVHWTLEAGRDLNANLVHLDPGSSVDTHTNDAVDVVLLVIHGSGRLTLDGDDHPLVPSTLALAPLGAERSIHAGPDGLSYATVHRRRTLGLGATRASEQDEGGEAPCFAHLLEDDAG